MIFDHTSHVEQRPLFDIEQRVQQDPAAGGRPDPNQGV
jgi:hypothetical protein